MEQAHYRSPTNYRRLKRLRSLLVLDREVPQCYPCSHVSQKTGKSCEHQRHWRWWVLHTLTNTQTCTQSYTHRLPERKPLIYVKTWMEPHVCAFPHRETHIQKAALSLIGSKLIPALFLCWYTIPTERKPSAFVQHNRLGSKVVGVYFWATHLVIYMRIGESGRK